MPAFLDRFGTKPSSKLQTPPNPNSKASSISPAASPPLPKLNLPRERTISVAGANSSGSVPNLILTHEDDSPISVATPGSLHRADSVATPMEPSRKKSLGQLNANSKSQHQRVATTPARVESDTTTQKPDLSQTPDPGANGSRSREPSAVNISQGQLTDSPPLSNGSQRSGSVSSIEGAAVTYQPLHLVESPNSDSHNNSTTRTRATSAASGKESGRASTLAVNDQREMKKRKSWRRPSASETSSQPLPFQLQTAPTIMSKKPQTRHQSTMGMGLASALAASGLGIIPPAHVMALSSTPSQSVNMPVHKKTSATSLGRSTASVSPVRSRRHRHATGRPREVSNASSSTTRRVDGTEGSNSDDSDYDSNDALDFGDDDIPITGFAVATMKRNQEFHDLFPTIPGDDYLIDDYGCALQRDILIQGRLYISENHLCFYANIFGWVTTLVIPFYNVKAVEKRMTAFVIPNAIGVTENSNKHTFASFLARDTAYDVIYNIWKHSRPETGSVEEDAAEEAPNGLLNGPGQVGGERGGPRRKATQCACGKTGAHYPNVSLEAVVSGTPEQIYNLMFQSGFIKDFLAHDQKLFDIQVSDWQPFPENSHLLSRNMSYIKPLSGGFGPKQTKCELRDENQHVDFNDYVSTITTTRNPDVPSGGVFSIKTRTCIMWAGASSSRVTVTYAIEWTGKSFIKGIIERSVIEGQLGYYKALDLAMRKYIAVNRKEFLPEGVDAAAADHEAELEEAALSPAVAEHTDLIPGGGLPVPSSRGLQWALDTFEGASKVAKDSFTGALDIIGDVISGLDTSSATVTRTTILTVTVIVLLISNVYTILTMGDMEAKGRRKALEKRGEEREKWVGEAVRAFIEAQRSMSEAAVVSTQSVSVSSPVLGVAATPVLEASTIVPPVPTALADVKAEVKSLVEAVDALERRIAVLKNQLEELD